MNTQHENYKELIWRLARSDFKLRYHGSFLGYLWAIIKPLLIFTILNFVFSSIFNPRNTGNPYYSLQLLTSLILFNFFIEGTNAGMMSFLAKSQLITKIYVPRWTIIFAATLNALFIFLFNLAIIIIFFALYRFAPSPLAVLAFAFSILLTYLLVIGLSIVLAPLYVRFRDLAMIWEVITTGLFYASPIIYPLAMMPIQVQRILLLNPMAFIIHFTKESLINNHFAESWQILLFVSALSIFLIFSILFYRRFSPRIAEEL